MAQNNLSWEIVAKNIQRDDSSLGAILGESEYFIPIYGFFRQWAGQCKNTYHGIARATIMGVYHAYSFCKIIDLVYK